jgi:hypothetical protein
MITAMVTRDLALPAPSGGGPVAVLGFQHLSYYLRALRLGDVKPDALPAPPKDDQLAGLVMGVDDQLPGSRS